MNQELLDSDGIKNHHSDIEIENGASFSPRLQLLAGALALMGLVATLSFEPQGLVLGPLFLIGGIFVLTSRHGVDISLETHYVREYHKRFLFIKSGKWIPMAAFSDICILKLGKTKVTSDLTGSVTTHLDASKNEVYLMTFDHRKRFLLKICKSQKEAVQFAEEMAEKLDKKFTTFNPKISAETQAKLRYRR
ncbi:hypothetical protein K6119_18925 [Paracrocinitomix mangrovi]|uniref:hypothetical protein n=1 Tax=Paracrocinitomix mangrovi TaxID=2862509 RepID=UPI001C8EC319|nr:hypothetical protein [Paracrocinitomix mangrovi]UKN01799.1 hypothetical protein K6119_18925 [Paracrocinitomix mangrovi]